MPRALKLSIPNRLYTYTEPPFHGGGSLNSSLFVHAYSPFYIFQKIRQSRIFCLAKPDSVERSETSPKRSEVKNRWDRLTRACRAHFNIYCLYHIDFTPIPAPDVILIVINNSLFGHIHLYQPRYASLTHFYILSIPYIL